MPPTSGADNAGVSASSDRDGSRSVGEHASSDRDRTRPACPDEPFAKMAAAIRNLALIPSPRTSGGPKGKPLRDEIKKVRDLAKAFADDCPDGLTPDDEQAFAMLRSLLSFIDAALRHFEHAKRQAQKLDYNDLIAKTHAVLTLPSSQVRKQISAGIRAVLVDEFQDTNSRQSELLASLCGDGSRLFLIGDDKQSIYKFQGAEVATFNSWREKIRTQSHGLKGDAKLLDLSFSFRSHPSIVNFVNRFFKLHFQSGDGAGNPHRASHQELTPARNEKTESRRVEVVMFDAAAAEGGRRDAVKAKQMEARSIAAWISEKIAEKTPVFCTREQKDRQVVFGDFAILCQANSDFTTIESELSDAGIPSVTFAGGGFLNRQEVLDVENMLRFLCNPSDDHALLGVLRSPFFSINDGVLHRLFVDEKGTLWQRTQAAARDENDDFESLRRPASILKQLLRDSKTAQVSDVVREVITITSYDISALALPKGRQKSRNVWKLADMALRHNQLSLTQFVHALEAMREIGAGKQTDAPLSAENAVKLMTIHKSKGLEFPIVILPGLSRKIHMITPKLLVHREFGIALDTSRSTDDPRPAYFRAASILNQRMDEEEKKRLLYVAMTRARDFLVMFAEQGARREVSFRLWLDQTLGLDEDTTVEGGNLVVDEHYVRRYVDDEALMKMQERAREITGDRKLSDDDLKVLSSEIAFDLLHPLTSGETHQTSSVPWPATLRVTATPETEPHATVLGNLFHGAMQRIVSGGALDAGTMLDAIAVEDLSVVDETLRKRLVDQCKRLLDVYSHSRLSEMLRSARRVLPEVGYTVFGDLGETAEKRPDLIFQDEGDRFHVVDFKTDKLSPEEVAAKINEHSAQVVEYVGDFATISGNQPSGWIYFAELGLLEEVKSKGFGVGTEGQLRLPFASR